MKKQKWLYAVYSDDVNYSDRYKVPNFCKIKTYSSRKVALKHADKKSNDQVFDVSIKAIRRMCR